MSDLRAELIQVAAVAVAIVEDLDYGEAYYTPEYPPPTTTEHVLLAVLDERIAQDKKWGPQHHDIHRWLSILMEEVGEAATAALEPASEAPLVESAVDS